MCALLLIAACVRPIGLSAADRASDRVRVHPFDLAQVRLLEGPFKEAMERNRAYLHGLELDRLLHTFRLNAGLPSSAQPLGGWEAPTIELRGHFVGHFLSACAFMVAASGDSVLKAKGDSVVAVLAECQKAIGSGYVSAYPESFIDRVETGQPVWAPWYTLHKIMAGLLDMARLTGNKQALDVLRRFAGWAGKRTARLDDSAMQRMLSVEFGGMNEVLRNLFPLTGDPAHLALARRFDHAAVLDPLAKHQDRLKGLHANTQIPKIIGAAREYEISGDRRYYEVATFFWDQVTRARSYPTGGTSYEEHWVGEPSTLSTSLGQFDHETCCTYNMLKLTRHLFSWEPSPRYADYYEQALLNGILPVQHPSNGMTMYYVPMGSGWYKTFGSPRESFWCCTGTGVELFATLGNSIYFHDRRTVYVNLFVPSVVTWKEKGVSLVQETRFPEQEGTSITVRAGKPTALTLALRVPEWTGQGGSVSVNGQKLESFAAPASYLLMTGTWKDGDRIDLELPMALHLSRFPDNPNRAAILYGPLVLAGELGADGLSREKLFGEYGPQGDPVPAPFFVTATPDLDAWIKPVPGRALSFRTQGAGHPADISLIPFYRLFDQRYALFWDMYAEWEWDSLSNASASMPAGVIDSVLVGDAASETEHNIQGFRIMRGSEEGRSWITSADWMKFDLKVPATRGATLVCTFTSPDTGRTPSVHVDGRRLDGPPAPANGSSGLHRVQYKIPREVTMGKRRVGVLLRVPRGEASRKLFGCTMVNDGW